jgi:HAD superfamily hydrolase (TIGR01549 family)
MLLQATISDNFQGNKGRDNVMPYKAILFDLDDTLYDLRSYWQGRLNSALEHVLARYPRLDQNALVKQAIAEKIYTEKFSGFLRAHGVDDEVLIARAQDVFASDWFARLELYDDAVHTLAALRRRCKLGLVTNGPSWTQRPKIERFRLAEYLDLLIVSEEVGVAKPDPAIFRIALDRLEVTPHETLFVGDSIEFDMRGAIAACVPFVWMNPRGDPLPPDLPPPLAELRRLRELVGLLDESTNGTDSERI